jgi:hypothetical protein
VLEVRSDGLRDESGGLDRIGDLDAKPHRVDVDRQSRLVSGMDEGVRHHFGSKELGGCDNVARETAQAVSHKTSGLRRVDD